MADFPIASSDCAANRGISAAPPTLR